MGHDHGGPASQDARGLPGGSPCHSIRSLRWTCTREQESLASDVTRKRSSVVLRGAVGKVPTEVTRWPPTLPHARFRGGESVVRHLPIPTNAGQAAYPFG